MCGHISGTNIWNSAKKIVFNKNGSVVKKSDKLWKEASSSIKNVVCGTTLYFYVAKDWNGLATKLKDYYRQNENPECAATVKKDSKIINDCPKLVFTIIFDKSEWLGLQPMWRREKNSAWRMDTSYNEEDLDVSTNTLSI